MEICPPPLCLYRPSHPLISLIEQQLKEVSDNATITVTQELESARPINRAAVLICIFEGKDGDLRVILTKRSSTLSSHSGNQYKDVILLLNRFFLLFINCNNGVKNAKMGFD